ncbi:MAG: CPBP family intramembrane glutamic endopeptidase [Planctomycetota bacterium]|jgi:membrane protease YdiL (CAAX protease family)
MAPAQKTTKKQTHAIEPTRPYPGLSDDHYFMRSQRPLQALVFLTPLIVLYEVGAIYYAPMMAGRDLVARRWMQDFFESFGATGNWLPGLAVLAVLLSWHIATKQSWRLYPKLYVGMTFESIALAIPLLLFGLLAAMATVGYTGVVGVTGSADMTLTHNMLCEMVLSVGAGLYEELVFRLVMIAMVHMILVDALKMPSVNGAVIAVLVSSLFFSASHFQGESWPWDLSKFLFFSVAGLYFALIYVFRGFGIVVATHAIYDILVTAIQYEALPVR